MQSSFTYDNFGRRTLRTLQMDNTKVSRIFDGAFGINYYIKSTWSKTINGGWNEKKIFILQENKKIFVVHRRRRLHYIVHYRDFYSN